MGLLTASHHPRRTILKAIIRLMAGLAVAMAGPAALADDSLESAVKAAFLYKFAPFVTWPAQAGETPTAPFVICVLGPEPLAGVLERAVAGQVVGQRPVVVRRLTATAFGAACQVAYLGGAPAPAVRQAELQLRGSPVLTVTDGGAAPGVIDFVLSDGRVRFRIDDQAAADNGLVISSKLLGLAISVKTRRAEGARP